MSRSGVVITPDDFARERGRLDTKKAEYHMSKSKSKGDAHALLANAITGAADFLESDWGEDPYTARMNRVDYKHETLYEAGLEDGEGNQLY